MNKKTTIIILLIVVWFVSLLGYQTINYFFVYNVNFKMSENYEDWMKEFDIIDTFIILRKSKVADDYITFKNVKIRNDFKEYTKLDKPVSTDDCVKYVLYGENNETLMSFWIGKSTSYVNMLKEDVTIFGNGVDILSKENRIKFLEDNNINNDVDLVKYFAKNKNMKNHFFNGTKTMKENFTMQYFAMSMFGDANSVILIDGDFSGFILNVQNKFKEVHILNEDEVITLTFLNSDNYTNDYIIDLIGTLVVE